ncbi:MAG: hypothetical protein PSY12_09945, partial [bacterium]|nr:hypothetical protein [bacterium]
LPSAPTSGTLIPSTAPMGGRGITVSTTRGGGVGGGGGGGVAQAASAASETSVRRAGKRMEMRQAAGINVSDGSATPDARQIPRREQA